MITKYGYGYAFGYRTKVAPLPPGMRAQWRPTLAALKDFLAANDGADNPHSLPAMDTPPTITTSTSDLAGTYPKWIVLATPSDVETYCLVEKGRKDSLVSTSFLRPYAATQAPGTPAGSSSRISVTANADVVAFYVIGTTSAFRFLVNDQYVDFTGTVPAATGGTGSNYIILTFASKASRKITIEMQQGAGLRRILIKNTDSYGPKPTAKEFRGIVFGDSLISGTGATHAGDGLAHIAADYLGMELWASGVGSTGYVDTAGGARYSLGQRLDTDLDAALQYGALDIVVVAMGLNDRDEVGVQAAASACFDTIRAKCPAALVFVVGTWDPAAPSAPSANYLATNAAIEAAVGSRGGFYYLDPQGVEYPDIDGTHPNTEGHEILGLWLDDQIRTVVAA